MAHSVWKVFLCLRNKQLTQRKKQVSSVSTRPCAMPLKGQITSVSLTTFCHYTKVRQANLQ